MDSRVRKARASRLVPNRSPIWWKDRLGREHKKEKKQKQTQKEKLKPKQEQNEVVADRGEVGDGGVIGVDAAGPHPVDQHLAQVQQEGHL